MCIARGLLLSLLPFLSFRGPTCERKKQFSTMEGNNLRGDNAIKLSQYFGEIVPSVRAFLFMMAAFGLFTIMILIIIYLCVKVLRILYPVPRAASDPVGLQPALADAGMQSARVEPEPGIIPSNGQQVRFRGADMSYPQTPANLRTCSKVLPKP